MSRPTTVFVTIDAAPVADPRFGIPATYTIPRELTRPLQFPSLAPRQACPATHGAIVNFPHDFGGFALGATGPVHPIIVASGARSGRVTADKRGGWYSVKTLWYAKSAYQGPVLIRGDRLDGPGTVTFGGGPDLGFIADTGTGMATGLVRTWPGATWVRSPGCYGFQIDGAGFTYQVVLAIRGPQSH